MGVLRGALKAAVALKALDVVRREAAKPANQQKARDLVTKVTNRRGGARER